MKFKIRVVAVNHIDSDKREDFENEVRAGLKLNQEYERLKFPDEFRDERWELEGRGITVSCEFAESSEFSAYFRNTNFISMYVDIAHFNAEDFEQGHYRYVLKAESLTEKRLLELLENKRNANFDKG